MASPITTPSARGHVQILGIESGDRIAWSFLTGKGLVKYNILSSDLSFSRVKNLFNRIIAAIWRSSYDKTTVSLNLKNVVQKYLSPLQSNSDKLLKSMPNTERCTLKAHLKGAKSCLEEIKQEFQKNGESSAVRDHLDAAITQVKDVVATLNRLSPEKKPTQEDKMFIEGARRLKHLSPDEVAEILQPPQVRSTYDDSLPLVPDYFRPSPTEDAYSNPTLSTPRARASKPFDDRTASDASSTTLSRSRSSSSTASPREDSPMAEPTERVERFTVDEVVNNKIKFPPIEISEELIARELVGYAEDVQEKVREALAEKFSSRPDLRLDAAKNHISRIHGYATEVVCTKLKQLIRDELKTAFGGRIPDAYRLTCDRIINSVHEQTLNRYCASKGGTISAGTFHFNAGTLRLNSDEEQILYRCIDSSSSLEIAKREIAGHLGVRGKKQAEIDRLADNTAEQARQLNALDIELRETSSRLERLRLSLAGLTSQQRDRDEMVARLDDAQKMIEKDNGENRAILQETITRLSQQIVERFPDLDSKSKDSKTKIAEEERKLYSLTDEKNALSDLLMEASEELSLERRALDCLTFSSSIHF